VRRWVRRFKEGELGQENLSDKTSIFFKDEFQKLVQHWQKCTEVRGDFIEK
jgi:hypothetical protein